MDEAAAPQAEKLFDRLHNYAKRIEVDGETFWRVEGDVLLDKRELRTYAQEREALEAARAAKKDLPLVVNVTQDGRIVRWAPGVELSYAVLRKTFAIGDDAGYELVVESIAKATADWEATCGVKFVYKPEFDKSDSMRPAGAMFVVRELDAKGQFIAAAFFPTDPPSRRRVLIDPSFYSAKLPFNRVGVLRHELGHVLGFRHEHIRSGKPPGCPDEDTYGTINLTDYDPQSVMHYFCGGLGSKDLAITAKDASASQQVYGIPLNKFHLAR
jgi:hypothetical protein